MKEFCALHEDSLYEILGLSIILMLCLKKNK
jgi:hypothetical protein